MMVGDEYRINERQLKRMIILETGTIGCLFVTLWSGTEQGLVAVLLSVIGSMLYGGLLIAIGRSDGGFYAMTERTLSGFGYRIVWLIYVVRFILRGAWLISFFEYFIHETIFPYGRYMILLPFLIISIYAGSRNLERRARFVELIFWWVVIPLIFIFIIGLWKVDYSELLPESAINIRQAFSDEYQLMALFLPLEFLLFRMSAMEGRDCMVRNQAMRGVLLAGLWIILIYIVTVGILGITWGHMSLLGVTNAMEQIAIRGGGLERLDIIILLFWIVGGIISVSAYWFQGQQLLQRIFTSRWLCGSYGGMLWSTLVMALASFAVSFCFDGVEEWTNWYHAFACYIDFPISVLLPVGIWLISLIKKK